MKLREVLDQLTYGELSQLGLVDQTSGQIPASKYPQLVSHINLGLTDLFKRFKLKESSAAFTFQPGAYLYQLRAADLVKIVSVKTPKGLEVPLNTTDSLSCSTPRVNTLSVPKAFVDGSSSLPEAYRVNGLEVFYQANHQKLVSTLDEDIEPDDVELELPQTHLQALLLFVASRVHNPIGMVNEFNAGNNYAAKYEAEVMSLKNDGIQAESHAESTRFERGGWA